MTEALSVGREHAHTRVLVAVYASDAEWAVGSPERAQSLTEEIVALSSELGFPFWLGLGMIFQGGSLTSIARAGEGLALLTKALAAVRATGAAIYTPLALLFIAEAQAKLGRSHEGLNCLDEAAQIMERTDERKDEAEMHRLRGYLLSATGNLAAAEHSFQQAVIIAQRQCAKTFELRAATSLARLWRDQGKRAKARDVLAPVYAWFAEGFNTPILQDAKALLDTLESRGAN